MGLLDMLLTNQGGGVVKQLAANFNISESDAQSAVTKLVPALSQGLRRNTSNSGGLEALIGALSGGGHDRYIDDLSRLGRQETVDDGNGILGHLFGSKEVSREVATRAASDTGLDSTLLKKMLPVLATLVMGMLSKQASSGGLGQLTGGSSGAGGGIGDLLGSMLDADGDGSVADDLLGLAGRFLRG
jgi:hypothetical protein